MFGTACCGGAICAWASKTGNLMKFGSATRVLFAWLAVLRLSSRSLARSMSNEEAMAASELADPTLRQAGAVDRRKLVTEANGEQGWRHREPRSDAQGP